MKRKKEIKEKRLSGNFSNMECADEELRFKLALSQSNISVFHHDLQGRCTWSHNCTIDRDQLLGKTDDQVMPAEPADILTRLKNKALSAPGVQEAEVCIEGNSESGSQNLWCLVKAVRTVDDSGNVIGTTSVSFDITERKRWETHLKLLMREVNHRSRNLLAVLTSISRYTCANAADLEEFQEKFANRLQCLAKTNELITKDQWSESSLEQTLDLQLSVHRQNQKGQINFHGEEVQLKPKAVQSLGLAMGELATNSIKYGALSVTTGCVDISWEVRNTENDSMLEITWCETGGPEVVPPEKEGFGSLLLRHIVGEELGGTSDLKFLASGIEWKTEIGKMNFVHSSHQTQTESKEKKPFDRENELRQELDLALG